MRLFIFLFYITTSLSCQHSYRTDAQTTKSTDPIICSDSNCQGKYVGPEFIKGSDVAHQFSNTMSGIVGDKLKELYKEGIYSQVDFKNIIMTTNGMGSGEVIYYLSIPFKRVSDQCEAYTSFDHVGGWNHTPALSKRKKQLSGLLLDNDILRISELKKTPEGLEEYWIQWRHKEVQKECN